jgi:hypothetical protein
MPSSSDRATVFRQFEIPPPVRKVRVPVPSPTPRVELDALVVGDDKLISNNGAEEREFAVVFLKPT